MEGQDERAPEHTKSPPHSRNRNHPQPFISERLKNNDKPNKQVKQIGIFLFTPGGNHFSLERPSFVKDQSNRVVTRNETEQAIRTHVPAGKGFCSPYMGIILLSLE